MQVVGSVAAGTNLPTIFPAVRPHTSTVIPSARNGAIASKIMIDRVDPMLKRDPLFSEGIPMSNSNSNDNCLNQSILDEAFSNVNLDRSMPSIKSDDFSSGFLNSFLNGGVSADAARTAPKGPTPQATATSSAVASKSPSPVKATKAKGRESGKGPMKRRPEENHNGHTGHTGHTQNLTGHTPNLTPHIPNLNEHTPESLEKIERINRSLEAVEAKVQQQNGTGSRAIVGVHVNGINGINGINGAAGQDNDILRQSMNEAEITSK